MGALVDITGQRFGLLVAIERTGLDPYGRVLWTCACDCGRPALIAGHQLRQGRTRSCGCLTFGSSIDAAAVSAARFAAYTRETPGGCVEWAGHIDRHGYGVFTVQNMSRLAHRVAWALAHGSTPQHAQVCHHCDNRRCVNVAHLFLGTNADNQRDSVAKGRNRHPRPRGVRVVNSENHITSGAA